MVHYVSTGMHVHNETLCMYMLHESKYFFIIIMYIEKNIYTQSCPTLGRGREGRGYMKQLKWGPYGNVMWQTQACARQSRRAA